MLKTVQHASLFGTLLLGLFAACPNASAAEGDPIAIVRAADGSISIESMWNLSVIIESADPSESQTMNHADRTALSGRGRAELRLMRSAKGKIESAAKLNDSEVAAGNFTAALSGGVLSEHVLDRLPNHATATWQPVSAAQPSPSAMLVRAVDGVVVVQCDGVSFAQFIDAELSKPAVDALKDCDVLIYDGDVGNNMQAVATAKESGANALILQSAGDLESVKLLSYNTFAVSKGASKSASKNDDSMRIMTLKNSPSEMPKELGKLMLKKEVSCTNQQEVFAALTTAQMNFKPSNGSHTPRWNTEHMMGRELLFFSQIFHAIDDAIPVMDLNPKQMPPDYRAKHADWTGNEEASQMERVSAFTRRFAHLLADLPLDKKPSGSFWTPRKLLLQMDRHYSEHTTNVQKKFKLSDWPGK